MADATTTMTYDQARKKLFGALRERCGRAWDEYNGPGMADIELAALEVDEAVKELDAMIAAGEEVERVPIVLRLIEGHAQEAVKRAPMLKQALVVIGEVARDPELFEHLRDPIRTLSKGVAKHMELGRNTAQKALKAIAKGEQYLDRQRNGTEAAGEAWAAALLDLERLCAGASAEGKRWAEWYAAACAAAKARDAAKLAALRKAVPPAAAIDAIGALPRDRPFAAFEREFKVAELPKALQDTIKRDTAKVWPRYGSAQALAIHRAMLLKQVDGLSIEPVDARKALAALKLPPGALPALKTAVSEPPGKREKALEAVGRKHGAAAANGRHMVATLEKAGVL